MAEVPDSVGEYVMVQSDDTPLPARRHVEGLTVPEPVLLKETVPVGVIAVPDAVSVTTAVHSEEEPTCRDEGEHVRPVEVLRVAVSTARAKVLELP
jgi:hypothetical protein